MIFKTRKTVKSKNHNDDDDVVVKGDDEENEDDIICGSYIYICTYHTYIHTNIYIVDVCETVAVTVTVVIAAIVVMVGY